MIESRPAPDHRGPLKRTLCALVLSCGIGLGLGQTASAQFAFEDAILPPRVVAWRLADRGFSGMSRPRFDGRVYVVDAVNPAGVPVRLFVDPAQGAIVGRQRLGAPETYPREAYARLERPAPGFGWTEEETGPRRALRPPSPDDPSGPAPRPVRRPGVEAARPDSNPTGLNPDGTLRPEPPRKVARAVQPSRQPELKPALRTTPEAPPPKIAPVEAARPAAKPDAPAAAIEQAPAAIGNAPAATGNAPAADGQSKAAAEGVRADAAKAAAPDWRDPPAEGRKPVRVIGGATVVPGTADGKEPAKEPGQ